MESTAEQSQSKQTCNNDSIESYKIFMSFEIKLEIFGSITLEIFSPLPRFKAPFRREESESQLPYMLNIMLWYLLQRAISRRES